MIRLLALIGAIAAAATASAQPAFTPAPTFSAPHPAVVRVAVPERDGAAYGSGALVAVNETTGLVVTNWHVVCDAAGPIAVYFPGGFRSPATVLRMDRDWDLAALAIWRPNVQPIARIERGAPARRAADDCRLWQRVVSRGDRAIDAIRFARRQSAVRDDRAQRAGAAGRLGRTDPQQPRRAGRRVVRHGLWTDHRQLLRPAPLVPRLGRRRFPTRLIAGVVGPTIASQSAAGGRHQLPSPFRERRASSLSLRNGPTDSPRPLAGEGQGVRAVGVQPVVELPGYSSNSSPPTRMSGVPVSAIPSPPAGLLPNTDQIRSILALIGAIAILYRRCDSSAGRSGSAEGYETGNFTKTCNRREGVADRSMLSWRTRPISTRPSSRVRYSKK